MAKITGVILWLLSFYVPLHWWFPVSSPLCNVLCIPFPGFHLFDNKNGGYTVLVNSSCGLSLPPTWVIVAAAPLLWSLRWCVHIQGPFTPEHGAVKVHFCAHFSLQARTQCSHTWVPLFGLKAHWANEEYLQLPNCKVVQYHTVLCGMIKVPLFIMNHFYIRKIFPQHPTNP